MEKTTMTKTWYDEDEETNTYERTKYHQQKYEGRFKNGRWENKLNEIDENELVKILNTMTKVFLSNEIDKQWNLLERLHFYTSIKQRLTFHFFVQNPTCFKGEENDFNVNFWNLNKVLEI